MAMAQNSEALVCPALLQESVKEISEFIARGQRVAFGLMTVNHALAPQDTLTAKLAVTHLFQIIGVSQILKELMEVGSRFKDPILPLFNSNGVQDAMSCVRSSYPILKNLETILRNSDQHISPDLMGPLPAEKVDSEWRLVNPLPQLDSYLQQLALLVSVGKSEQIQRISFGDRSPPETNELQRLVFATRNLLQKKEPSTRDILQNPFGAHVYQPQRPLYTAPKPLFDQPMIRSIKELQHPCGFRGRYGEPDYPFPDKRPFVQLDPAEPYLELKKSFEESEFDRYNLNLQGKYPNTAMFGCWPPTFVGENTVQERQIQSIFTNDKRPHPSPVRETTEEKSKEKSEEKPVEKASDEDTDKRQIIEREDSAETHSEFEVLSHSDAAFNTPNSTRDSTPTIALNENSAQVEATGAPSTEAIPITEPNTSESASKSGEQTPVAASFNPSDKVEDFEAEKLEACILSPHVENAFNAIEWSSKVERLPLSQAQIQAQLNKLGPEYSVVDTISTLTPEEWRSIADYTKPRGILLSVGKSHKVTMPTKFGSFDIASLIFIVKIVYPPTDPKKGSFGFRNPFAATTPGLFGNPLPPTQTSHLFETPNGEKQRNGGLFGTRSTGGLFGNPQPPTQTTGLFGQSRPLFGTSGGGLFGTSQPQTTSLFGTTNTGGHTGFGGPSSGTTGGLFGGSQPPMQPTNLFNTTTSTTQTGFGTTTQTGFGNTVQAGFGPGTTGTRPFGTSITNSFNANTNTNGNQTGGGLFGGFQQSQNEPQSSLFSGFTQSQTAPQPSPFGSADPTATQRPSLFSSFGSSSQSQTQPTLSPFSTPVGQQEQTQARAPHSLFSDLGAQTQTPTSPFSSFWSKAQSQAQPSTSLFSNPESQTQRSSLFAPATTQPQPSSSLFGQPATQTQNSSSLFGQTTSQTQPTPSLFPNVTSQTQSPSLFATPASQPQSTFPLFSQLANRTQTSSLFGQTPNQTNTSTSVFGQPQQPQTQPAPSLSSNFPQHQQTQSQTQTQLAPSPFAALPSSLSIDTAKPQPQQQQQQSASPAFSSTKRDNGIAGPAPAASSKAAGPGFRFGNPSTWRRDEVVESKRRWRLKERSRKR